MTADWQEKFVEQVALLADEGFPRSVTRLLAWLVVCEPQHQSAEQLRTTLKLSAGSVSSAVTTLVRAGIVTRVTFAGDRRIYYQLHADGWSRLLRSRIELLAQVRQVAGNALRAGGEGDERLKGMYDFYASCEAKMAELLEAPRALEAPRDSEVPQERDARKSRRQTLR